MIVIVETSWSDFHWTAAAAAAGHRGRCVVSE